MPSEPNTSEGRYIQVHVERIDECGSLGNHGQKLTLGALVGITVGVVDGLWLGVLVGVNVGGVVGNL